MNPRKLLFNASGARRTELCIEHVRDAEALDSGEVLPEFDRVFCRRIGGKVYELGREYQAAMTTQAILVSVYEIPYDEKTKDITPRMRVRIDGCRYLNIASVVDYEDRHEKIILGLTESVET